LKKPPRSGGSVVTLYIEINLRGFSRGEQPGARRRWLCPRGAPKGKKPGNKKSCGLPQTIRGGGWRKCGGRRDKNRAPPRGVAIRRVREFVRGYPTFGGPLQPAWGAVWNRKGRKFQQGARSGGRVTRNFLPVGGLAPGRPGPTATGEGSTGRGGKGPSAGGARFADPRGLPQRGLGGVRMGQRKKPSPCSERCSGGTHTLGIFGRLPEGGGGTFAQF